MCVCVCGGGAIVVVGGGVFGLFLSYKVFFVIFML